MRIITWNMDHWKHKRVHDDAWQWIIDTLDPDIALLQECVPPAWAYENRTVLFNRVYPESRQKWGTAIMTKLTASRTTIPEVDDWLSKLPRNIPGTDKQSWIYQLKGWCECAQIRFIPDETTLVISVYSSAYHIERELLKNIDISGIKLKLNPDLWLLDVIFYYLKNYLDRRILVGGDFNYSRLLDPPDRPRGNNEFFDRIKNEGFVSLHRLFHDNDERTFFQAKRKPLQLDYLYTDAVLAKRVSRCDVVPYSEVERFSDHAPLIAEI